MMSSPGRASDAFPLHVLVWNNEYRRLDEELQDQVTAALLGRESLSCAPGSVPGWWDCSPSAPVYLWV